MRRGKRRNRGGGDTYVYNANTYNTSITNVTSVSQVAYGHGHMPYGQKRMQHGERKERPPKLLRFYASGGLMDRHLVNRMSDSEHMGEAANLVAYGAKKVGNSVCDVAGGIVGLAGSLLADFVGIIRDMI